MSKEKQTYTERLSKDEIKEFLTDYEPVNDVNKLQLGDHIRYFKKENNEMKFRMGGVLINKNGLPDYIILTIGGGAKGWSVQLNTAQLFRKIKVEDIRNEYSEKIKEKDQIITELTKYIKKLQKDIIKLESNDDTKKKMKKVVKKAKKAKK